MSGQKNVPADVIAQVRAHRDWAAKFDAIADELQPIQARFEELRATEPYLIGDNGIQVWDLSNPGSAIYQAIASLLDDQEATR